MIVQLTQVEGTCAQIVGKCSEMNCPSHCRSLQPGASSHCGFFNLCTCFYMIGHPPGSRQPYCNLGLGKCDKDCDSSCCNTKCASTYKHYSPTGSCVQEYGMNLCICSYNE